MTMRFVTPLFFALLFGSASTATAKVLHSREGAFKLAFPRAEKVERKHVYLSASQLAAIEKLCRCKQKSKLMTVYIGKRGQQTLGYAYIDTHVVRTLPETFMVVLDPAGKVEGVHILAFHEPPEYMPRPRWLAQFKGRAGGAKLRVQGGIAGIAGATLSAHAVTRATRRILAVHQMIGLGAKAAALTAQRAGR